VTVQKVCEWRLWSRNIILLVRPLIEDFSSTNHEHDNQVLVSLKRMYPFYYSCSNVNGTEKSAILLTNANVLLLKCYVKRTCPPPPHRLMTTDKWITTFLQYVYLMSYTNWPSVHTSGGSMRYTFDIDLFERFELLRCRTWLKTFGYSLLNLKFFY